MKKIGFVGTGVMGAAMARNLMKSGFQVTVFNRTKSKAEALLSAGALWSESPAECAKDQDAVITIVGYPKDVEEVYFGTNGILAAARPGTYLIDMTTTSPKLSVKIHDAAQARGLHALDAPVTGGEAGAKAGTLSILAGGDRRDFEACLPIFQAMGGKVTYEGGPGCGQHTKMANQIALSGIIASVCEAIVYAEAAGLDPALMLDSISAGASGSWQLNSNGPKILKDDMRPGFYVKHYLKDMNIAAEEAEAAGVSLPILERVREMYRDLCEEGFGEKGTQALIHWYRK